MIIFPTIESVKIFLVAEHVFEGQVGYVGKNHKVIKIKVKENDIIVCHFPK